mgnify:CR=1 FL=1
MMDKLKKLIKEALFGRTAEPVCPKPKSGYKTTHHGDHTNFGDWCHQLNVSRLHKKDRVFFD